MPPVRPETPGHPFRDADPPAPSTDPFLLVVEDVFSITGRGTVVTGPVNRGTLRVGDHVEILGLGGPPIATTVTGIEMFRKLLEEATVGANVGLLLRDVARDAIWRGRAVVAPRSRTDRRAVRVELAAEAAARLPGDGAVRCQWYSARVDARVVRGESPGRSGVQAVRVELGSPLPLEPGDELVLWSGRDALGPAIVVAGLE